ncbi:MAG: cytochrome c biogenesis protein CcdA [Pseudomonadota bacterium]
MFFMCMTLFCTGASSAVHAANTVQSLEFVESRSDAMSPIDISLELIPLVGALDEAFLTHYLMEGEPSVDASNLPHMDAASEPQAFALIVWVEPQKGYYAYAHEPLTNTLPTTVTLLQYGEPVAVDTVYPAGTLTQDSFDVGKNIMAYMGRTAIVMTVPRTLFTQQDQVFSDMSAESLNAMLRANSMTIKVSGLLCSDSNCWPFTELFGEAEALLDDGVQTTGATDVGQGSSKLMALATAMRGGEQSSAHHVLEPQKMDAVRIPQWNFMPRYASPSLEVTGLGKALLFGLLAGLILNLMPCVLPVLGFKLHAFIAALGQEGSQAERVRAFREHNIFFALGIVTWFLVLAFILSWAGLAWGQLFQQIPVLFALMLVVFLLALSMFGLFNLPVLDIKTGTSSSPRSQAFMTGAVATLLATPCSGPLLGGVLGWAFGQSPIILAMVFVAVGLGMASPYVALSIWPKLVYKVPKAGSWTGTVEQIVGFFLMATAVYLLTILPQDLVIPTVYTLFVASLCAWIWGRWSGPTASTVQRIVVRLGASLVIVAMAIWTLSPQEPEEPLWMPFDAAYVESQLGHEPLVLEFTADWCPNCKALERTTLTHDNVRAWAKEYGVRFIRVDLTRKETFNDAAAEALLHALGSSSIPLVALFPKGEEYKNPLVLRDIFTPSQMDEALKAAFGHQ